MKHTDVQTDAFTKDSSGMIILLAALFFMIVSALFSGAPATAKQHAADGANAPRVEVIEVVATRLK